VINATTNVAALVYFIPSGNIIWLAAGVMALANISGSFAGSHMAIKRGAPFVRRLFLIVIAVLISVTTPSKSGRHKKQNPPAAGFEISKLIEALLDLRFFIRNVLASNRIVLLQFQLVRHGALVLAGRVVMSGTGAGHEFDLFAG
jgi:hypothetical protein